MRKIVFVAAVLLASLFILQYTLVGGIIQRTTPQVPLMVIQKVSYEQHDQIFDTGDYIVVLKDGKYSVYKKRMPST